MINNIIQYRICWFAACTIAILTLFELESKSTDFNQTLPQTSKTEVVYQWKTQRCDEADTPDSPPRTFLDKYGRFILVSSHFTTRVMRADKNFKFIHICDPVMRSRMNDVPSEFADYQWLTSLFTNDGSVIYALIHNEYQGYRRRDMCISGIYLKCWYNTITTAISDDAGQTFRELPKDDNQIISLPYQYQKDYGRPFGYFQPTNIVEYEGMYYFMFLAEGYKDQKRGVCIARTRSLFTSAKWFTWNGTNFTNTFVDPYKNDAVGLEKHLCEPVGSGSLFEIGSLHFDEDNKLFVGLTSISRENGSPEHPAGAYITESKDGIIWSKPILLIAEKDLIRSDITSRIGFYSIVVHGCRNSNCKIFNNSDTLYLYYVRFNSAVNNLDRNLERLKIKMAVPFNAAQPVR